MEICLWVVLENDIYREQLLILATRHVKLALEFSQRGTSLERKQEIKTEVESLRTERNRLLHEIST
jgi:hypothetical protein